MRRAVKALPASRDAVVQGAAATLLRPPGAAQAGISLTDAAVAASALTTLRDVCAVWRGAVADEAERARVEAELTPSKPDAAGTGLGPAASLGTLRPESAGLLLLCSPSPSVRAAAVDMLKEVAALAAALRRSGGVVDAGTAAAGGGGSDEGGKGPGPGSDLDARGAPPSMSAILDACAGDMMWSALGGDERPADAASLGHLTGEAAPGSPSSSSLARTVRRRRRRAATRRRRRRRRRRRAAPRRWRGTRAAARGLRRSARSRRARRRRARR